MRRRDHGDERGQADEQGEATAHYFAGAPPFECDAAGGLTPPVPGSTPPPEPPAPDPPPPPSPLAVPLPPPPLPVPADGAPCEGAWVLGAAGPTLEPPLGAGAAPDPALAPLPLLCFFFARDGVVTAPDGAGTAWG